MNSYLSPLLLGITLGATLFFGGLDMTDWQTYAATAGATALYAAGELAKQKR